MGMRPLQTGLVVMLFAVVVQQIEFVDHAFLFQYFERAVDGNPVDFRVSLLGQLEQLIGVQVPMSIVDNLEQQLALPGESNSMRLQRRSCWRFGWQDGDLERPHPTIGSPDDLLDSRIRCAPPRVY